MTTLTAIEELRALGIEVHDTLARPAELLRRWVGGFHHMPHGTLRQIDWLRSYVSLTWWGNLASFDGDELTRLVFLAHDLAVRVDVQPASAQRVRILLHPRKSCGDTIGVRHPGLEEAVARWREANPTPYATQTNPHID